MELRSGSLAVTLCNHSPYADSLLDTGQYSTTHDLADPGYRRPSSRHGVRCTGADRSESNCLLLAGGGATCVHDHSAVIVADRCFVAVGDMLCSLVLPRLQLAWATKVDWFTCFGVYYSSRYDCLISHGEHAIACLDLSGKIVWSVGGPDIFTGPFTLLQDHVEAADFNGQVFRFHITAG